ncbi:MAG: glycerol-3-phosphate 1-O-acyltransferase PlsY [Planctomyces sp.]|nr:glycerol-3-phosphate 1-O-acyltransferase PlsY [Planctomyces sp.]
MSDSPLPPLLAALAGYLIGSIPFSLLLGRAAGGIDIRQHGSGNVGATNVARLLGWRWGGLALVLDALKGLAAVWLAPRLAFAPSLNVLVLCGLAAILGHMYPCWLGFRGGKGVATSLGVVAMLAPWPALAAVIAFGVCFALTRYVSLGSIVAAVVFAGAHLAMTWPDSFSDRGWSLSAFSVAVPLLVIWRHRSNIQRLMRGEERALTRGPEPPSTPEGPDAEADGAPGS